jgi:hypothetical protein
MRSTTYRGSSLLTASILALCAAAPSCGSDTGHAGAPRAEEEMTNLPSVPTPEEADQKASAQISQDNADAELEKLKKELEDG